MLWLLMVIACSVEGEGVTTVWSLSTRMISEMREASVVELIGVSVMETVGATESLLEKLKMIGSGNSVSARSLMLFASISPSQLS